ncbi:MAG TPA: hypothetical protein VIK14_00060 [Ignavibacteria bacterium]
MQKEKKQETPLRYFVGRPLQDLIFEITKMFVPDYDGDNSFHPKLTIVPVNPKPFKLWWEFYFGNNKICTICCEAQDERNGTNNLCWLEWYDKRYGSFFYELYASEIGLPDWFETEEHEREFFKTA